MLFTKAETMRVKTTSSGQGKGKGKGKGSTYDASRSPEQLNSSETPASPKAVTFAKAARKTPSNTLVTPHRVGQPHESKKATRRFRPGVVALREIK